MLKKIMLFLKQDIWRIRLSKTPPKQSFIIRNLRIILLALRGFDEDNCSLHASALTFYTLLSVVPIFAMAFGVAKGFGFDKILEKQMLEKFPLQSEVFVNIINFAHTLLENTKGGIIAGVGVALLFWAVIKVLTHIERSFNNIWGIKTLRPIGRRFSDYLSVMLICPVLLIVSSGITVFINSQAVMIIQKIEFLGIMSPLIYFFLELLPYTVIWVVFSFIYVFVPNTRVNFSSAILAGVVTGTIYQLVQWIYVDFQLGVAKYNAIYGSFAALPLFLVWLQLSWRIMLFGAEISFAHQNVDTYEFEPDSLRVNQAFKRILSLRIVTLLVQNFSNAMPPFTATQISHALEIPVRLVRDILYELVEAGVIISVKYSEDRALAYQPGIDIEKITVGYVISKLEYRGTDKIPVVEDRELNALKESMRNFAELIEKSPANVKLYKI